MIIIGITGTIGSGKGTIVDYIVEKHGYKHLSVRQFLIDIILERGLTPNRDSMVSVANELRTTHEPSYIIDRLYEKAFKSGENCIIESIRTPGEIDSLQQKDNFYLFAVDAEPQKRYERIVIRNSETDNISFETFLANEEREMKSDNPNHQNLSKCIKLANYVFTNNNTIIDLHEKIEVVLHEINSK